MEVGYECDITLRACNGVEKMVWNGRGPQPPEGLPSPLPTPLFLYFILNML